MPSPVQMVSALVGIFITHMPSLYTLLGNAWTDSRSTTGTFICVLMDRFSKHRPFIDYYYQPNDSYNSNCTALVLWFGYDLLLKLY